VSSADRAPWQEVLAFWFPERQAAELDADTHREQWRWRLHGGADDAILARFSELTAQGARGELDHWAADPEGRLALIVVLDQFSRAVWRGTARAYAQDPAALALALEGLADGHCQALAAPWLQVAQTQPLGHCEGPDHLARAERLIELREAVAAKAPEPLRPVYRSLGDQARKVRDVIAAFGRHPHRNAVLGRPSTAAEQAYVERGEFPHLQALRGAVS